MFSLKVIILISLSLLIQCKHPILYQLNARAWLYELSKKYKILITKIKDIPSAEFDYLQENNIDIVWVMGVWKLGKYGLEFDKKLDYSNVLPDWNEDDVIGSPFAITEYTCNLDIGTNEDLIWLREQLNSRNMKLMLDFVPNHSAVDAPTAQSNRKLYVRAPEGKSDPSRYTDSGFAYGKYHGIEPWRDVIQWNYWEEETRKFMKDNLMTVLSYADGVRCDVASLMLNDVFGETWKEEMEYWGYKKPKNEFWEYALKEAKEKYPNSIFLAEVFVDWEIELLYKLGFTYTYNLDLLQKLKGDSNEVNTYMKSLTLNYLEHSAHFVENHDIERVVYSMGNNIEKAKAAGTIAATIGGMIFIYHGQWSGYENRLEVHLRRQVEEKENEDVKKYYQKLMKILKEPAFTSSSFHYIDNITGNLKDNLVAYIRETEDNHYLIVVNYSSKEGCSHVPIYNVEPKDGRANFLEVMEGYLYAISEDAIKKSGLIVCLNPWEAKIYKYNY